MIENFILDASKYNCAQHGMSHLAKFIYQLALKAFLHDKEDECTHEFMQLKYLRTLTDQRDNSASKNLVEDLSQSNLLSDYSNFIKKNIKSKKSLLIGNTSKKYQEVHDVIRADRERDFSLLTEPITLDGDMFT